MKELKQLYAEAVKAIKAIPFQEEWEVELIEMEYKIEDVHGDEATIGLYVNIKHRKHKYYTQSFYETSQDYGFLLNDILTQIYNRTMK